MPSQRRFLERPLLALVLLLVVRGAAGAKKSKDWSKVDFDKVEGEWRYGDEEEELITDDEMLFREMEARKEKGIDISDMMDADTVKHQQSMTGPAMMFIELVPKPNGGEYAEEELYNISGIWKDLLYTGGLNVNFYNIEESKLLCSMQKGWDGKAVREFLLSRPEVKKVTWDQQESEPKDDEAEEEAIRRRRVAKKKKEQQKKKKKGSTKTATSKKNAAAGAKKKKQKTRSKRERISALGQEF